MSQKPKKTPDYRLNKKAFDTVMNRLRGLGSPKIGQMGATVFHNTVGSPSAKNLVAPNAVEFKCDVLLAIKAAMPKGIRLAKFIQAYLLWDSEDYIEQSTFAQEVLGGRLHSVEQRIGMEFCKRKIYPLAGYMFPPRIPRGK